MKIVNVALQTEYTFKSVFQHVPEITNGQEIAVGVADLSNTYAHVGVQTACREAGIKPIFGVRTTVVGSTEVKPKNPGQSGPQYILLAKNVDGLREIYRLVKRSYEQFHFRPLTGILEIMRLSEDVIVIAEEVQFPERIDYLALTTTTRHSMLELDLPRIAINNNFYPKPDDRSTHQLLLGARGMVTQTYPQHILSTEEWLQLWPGEHEAIANTHEVADACNVELPHAQSIRYRGAETLEGLVAEGIKRKSYEMTPERKERIKYELNLINDKQFQDYFLIVADMVSKAKKDMLVGPARGSAAGSLVCFLIGITAVDPLKYGLLFERFIDINRHDMPDIDIDFPDAKRNSVIKELEESNGGKDYVTHIGTVSNMRGKAIINHAQKELNIPVEDIDDLKEVLIFRPPGDKRVGNCVIDTLTDTQIGSLFYKRYPMMKHVARFENHATHTGKHAAGIIVCNEPLTHYAGVNARDNTCMIDYRQAEQLNLLKIDVLGLRTLTVLQDCANLAGFDFNDFYTMPMEDDNVFKLFRDVRVNGVFQFEGFALRGLCRKIKVRSFNDMSAMTALARPGPLKGGGATSYGLRHSGIEPVEYICDSDVVINATKDTFGVLIYQEQIMWICKGLGMTWEETSHFRKVVSKRQGMERLSGFLDIFMNAATTTGGLSQQEAQDVWDSMITFGVYGFNMSHSVAYAILSYWTAWCKVYHPLEFAAANLNNPRDEEDAVRLLRDIVRHDGIEYSPVDPDESDVTWTIKDGKLLGGLTNIDGIGISNARAIIRNRKNGKPDTPSIAQKLLHPKTAFDVLFPCAHYFGDYFDNPEHYKLKQPPTEIENIIGKGDYIFIAKVVSFKVKDLNSVENVNKRGDELEENPLALNVVMEDDTDTIMGRINRFNFEVDGRAIMDRDETGVSSWYMFKGKIIGDDIRFVFIDNIFFLGQTD